MQRAQNEFKHYFMAIIACSLGILFYAYEFTIRTIPSAITIELMRDFNISAAGLGMLSSLFYYGYSIMQVPVGLLYDKLGARILLTSSMGACALSTLLFGLAPNIYIADLAFFIIGFSSSFAFVGSLVLASRLFPAKYFAMIAGIVQFVGCIGAIVGQTPIAVTSEHMGWRNAVYICVVVGIGIVLLMWFFLKEREGYTSNTNTGIKKTEIKHLKVVCQNPQTWWIALYSFSSWAPVIIFTGLWGVPFLMTVYHTSATIATTGTVAMWLGIAISGPIFGWWSDRIARRCFPLAFCSLLGLVSSITIIYVPNISWSMMYILLFIFGMAGAGQALSFGVVQDNNSSNVVGTATGFNNMAVIAGGIFLQPLVGLILKFHWSGQMLNNAPVYSLSNYRTALITLPLSSLLGLILSIFFIKETYCKPQYNPTNEKVTLKNEKSFDVLEKCI